MAVPAATTGRRRIPTSNSGSGARCSRSTNKPVRTTPASTATITTGDDQPRSGPSITPNIKAPSPDTERSAPATSRPPTSGLRDSGMTRSPTTTPTATMGTLTMNTDPHQKWARSRPPTTGPIASPAAPKTAHSAIAFPRSAGGYKTATMANAGAITAAAPTPITARAAISAPVDELSAASRQLNPKRLYPPRNTFRRPYRSARPPPRTRSPARTML